MLNPKDYPRHMVEIPREKWPDTSFLYQVPVSVWLSRDFLAQVFDEENMGDCEKGVIRITVNRAQRVKGNWRGEITWDELQIIKRELGYGDSFAIEIYPGDMDVVNVANMRHIWVLPKPLNVGWFK